MLSGVLIFLLLVVGLLAMPVTMTYRLSWKHAISGDLKVRWAFGLVRFGASSDQAKSQSTEAEPGRPKVGRAGQPSGNRPNMLAAIRDRPFRRRLIKFISDVWFAVRKNNVRLLVRLGLGDPADTGQLWAAVGPISGLLANNRGVSIAIQPDFFDTTFELDSSGTLRLIPAQLTYIVLGLLFSPTFWRGALRMRTPG